MGCLWDPHDDGEQKLPHKVWGFFRSLRFSRRRKDTSSASEDGRNDADEAVPPRLNELTVFSLAELKAATRNFHEKIGEGGFGDVYKGVIRSRRAGKNEERLEVAVKKLNAKGMQGQKEWLSEITYLRLVDHPNLVKLIGFCVEDDERGPESLLVYEYMPNKSLDEHIFRKSGAVLPWKQRLEIAIGTARGLAYLHEEMKPPIVYRDLKAANILLDDEFNPKLSDFGLARHGPVMGDTHVTTKVVGTAGYAAPEYVQTGHLTLKSDVWSFGMVLLELVTGRRALDRNRPRSERSLGEWARPFMNDRRFHKIIDPRLRLEYPESQARAVLSLVQRCTVKQQRMRPKMSEVARQLVRITDSSSSSSSHRLLGDKIVADKIDEEPRSKSSSEFVKQDAAAADSSNDKRLLTRTASF